MAWVAFVDLDDVFTQVRSLLRRFIPVILSVGTMLISSDHALAFDTALEIMLAVNINHMLIRFVSIGSPQHMSATCCETRSSIFS